MIKTGQKIDKKRAAAISACASLMLAGCVGSTSKNAANTLSAAAPTSSSAYTSATGNAGARAYAGELLEVAQLPAPANTNNGTDVPIAIGDLIEIDVFQVNDLDKEVRVEANGNISLPLIGTVRAADKSVSQLEKEIEQRYGQKYLQSPDVTVTMKESVGQKITLNGEFTKPGVYLNQINGTLLQSTALAGGLTALADEKKIYVFRQIDGKRYVANYSIKNIRQGKQPDPRIFGGDIIVAFQSNSKVAKQNLREALGMAVSAVRVAAPL